MIGEGHGDAVFQRRCRQGLVGWQAQLAIADESELRLIEVAPLFDQRGLAMDIKADRAASLVPAKPECGAGARLFREIGGLAPFQRFRERPDFVELVGGFEDQCARVHQRLARGGGAGVQRFGHDRWRGGKGGGGRHRSAPFLRRFAGLPMRRASRIRFKGCSLGDRAISALPGAPLGWVYV